jgi:hypothetical protein
MTPNLPLVRLKLACADVLEYDRERAGEIARDGVFVPSRRQRAAGERVRLTIELLDGTYAYTGLAVVVGEEPGPREGYRVLLEPAAEGGVPAPARIPVQSMAEALFDDLAPAPPVPVSPPARRTPLQQPQRAPSPTPPPIRAPTPPPIRALTPPPTPAPTPTPAPLPPPRLARTPVAVLGKLRSPPADEEPELIHLPPPEPDEG